MLLAANQSLRRPSAFAALQNHDFRWFWMARVASYATMEMGSVARGWLAYQLTGSALALAWVSSGQSIARLIVSLYAGALADRFEKRQLLLITRALTAANTLIVAILVLTGSIRVWHLVVSSFAGGIISSFMMPAQQAYLSQLVGRKALMNAVSVTTVGRGVVGIFGAALAGFAIDWFGVESVYLAMVALHLWALFALTRLSMAGHGSNGDGSSVWEDLRGGLTYLKTQPILVPLLAIALVRAILGWSHRSLLPVYVEDVLGLGASGLGLLTAAPSFGSLVGAAVLASLGNLQGKGRVLLLAGLVAGLSLVAFANSSSFVLVFFFLALVGAARNTTMITNQTLIQSTAAGPYRGRVMAMYMMCMGLMPLGTLSAGAIADAMGVPFAVTVQGGLLLAIFAGFWLTRSRIRYLP